MLTHFCDIFLNPFQEHSLIKQAIIKVAILTNLFACKEAQGPYAIVEVHEYNAVSRLLDHPSTIIIGVGVGLVAPTLNVDPGLQLRFLCSIARREDIDEETVFGESVTDCLASANAKRPKLTA